MTTDTWDDYEESGDRWELTDEALQIEEIADRLIAKFVFLDRDEVLKVLRGEEDEE